MNKWPQIFDLLPQNWKDFLTNTNAQLYEKCFNSLSEFVVKNYSLKPDKIYPPKNHLFACFDLPPEHVKCVIVGQDPYHGKNQANGLCFSVNPNISIPPSLQNIFKELKNDLGFEIPNHGDLGSWKNNGVLLLNTVLTVEAGKPASHKNYGWEVFTELVVQALATQRENIVFILWGSKAKAIGEKISKSKHCLIESAHPSPYSEYSGFFGSKPFSKCNDYLRSKSITPIDWKIK